MNMRSLLAVLLLAAASSHAAEKVVVYNWAEYIPEGVLDEFTEETGIEVEYSTYDSNDTMYAKLQLQKGKGYDVVVPSTYLVSKMRGEGLLHEIDKSKLTNFKHLDPNLLNKPYDPDNQYSIPYLWGSAGIAVNSSVIDPATVTSWIDLWDPKWKNSLLLTDDVRDVFTMALKIDGHSTNATDPAEIKQAYERLVALMPNVLVFDADAPRAPFLAGDVNLGMVWNGEAVMAQEENPDIQYIYPSEGIGFWADSFAIPAGAEHVDNALKFIDFMLRPDIAARTVNDIGYATPNKTALGLLDEETRDNPAIFPPQDIVEKGEFQKDVGDAMKLYNEYWEKLKTGKQ